ncbi:FG-GAP repeat domain-containing protein [Actinokineospora sp. NPDC004072]
MRRTAVAAVAALLALLAPGTASAGNFRQPLLGDLNGDGRADRVVLGPDNAVTPTCSLQVEHRNADGTFAPPITHTYTSHYRTRPYCPDMGEVVDLGGDGVPELVLTAFQHSSASTQLIVLRDFIPIAPLPGLNFPSTLRKVDFNGDGLVDIWQSTDQSEQLVSYLNTPSGTLVPGPINLCSGRPIPQHAFADFDGDGGQDMLLSRRCPRGANFVELHFGSGRPPVQFARFPDSTTHEVFVTDLLNDGIPDVGLIARTSEGVLSVRHFRNDGGGSFTEV